MKTSADISTASRPFALPIGAALLALGVSVSGCNSRPAAIAPPDVDPESLSAALMEHYDRNSDGQLSTSELHETPALLDRMSVYDVDGSEALSTDELQTRMEKIFDGRTGLMAAACQVTRNGKPLKGAVVHFVPVPLLAEVLPVASGVTRSNGMTTLSIQRQDLPPNSPQRDGFIRPGLYLIEVTHPELNVPDHYNQKTTLGREVSPEVALAGAINVALEF